MEEMKADELKSWRERIGISQKKLSDFAKVSLATLRQLELGRNVPRKKTLMKIISAVKSIEGLSSSALEELKARKAGRKPGPKTAAKTAAKTVAKAAEKTARSEQTPKPATVPAMPMSSGSIKLSNLDLELINRILNMTAREKLDLLRKLS